MVLTLLVGGMEFALSHVNSSNVILRDAEVNFASTEAQLMVVVDGVVQQQQIFLPHGISEKERRVQYI